MIIKLATFNIRAGKGAADVFDRTRVCKKIPEIKADVVALQEVDKGLKRSCYMDEPTHIGQMTHMHSVFAKAIDFEGGKYGVAMLSNEVPIATRTVPLPGSEEKRVLLICEYKDYVVCCAHLSLVHEDRMSSIEIIESELCGHYNKPVFLMGDFNTKPDSAEIIRFEEKFKILSDMAKPTFPSTCLEICIDYILLLRECEDKVEIIETYTDDDNEASDHVYVSVKVSW